MNVVAKKFPTVGLTDVVYPVVIWKDRPEILHIAIFDHRRKKIGLREAKELYTQILFETNDFIFEKGEDNFKLDRLYKGVAVFNRHNNLKTLQTARHVCHIL